MTVVWHRQREVFAASQPRTTAQATAAFTWVGPSPDPGASEPGEFAVSLSRFFLGEGTARDSGVLDEVGELRGEQCGAEEEALVLVAAELGEERELLGGLDTLGDHL